jgi:hypothetical protein
LTIHLFNSIFVFSNFNFNIETTLKTDNMLFLSKRRSVIQYLDEYIPSLNPESLFSSSSCQFQDPNAQSAKIPLSKKATIQNGIETLNTKTVTSKLYKKISFDKVVGCKKKKVQTEMFKSKSFINTKI